MQEIAANLGSDCSFFIENTPVFATSRGDVFENIEFDLSNYYIVLAKPDLHISTPEAFSLVTPKCAPFLLKEINVTEISEWKDFVNNDFEKVAFHKFPEIKAIKEKMYELGAVYASMSGSGSAVYGIFEKEIDTKSLFNNCFVWQGKLT